MHGIVTIATSNPIYARMAGNLVSSLRSAGKYDGGIVVFTDLPESDFPDATRKAARIERAHHLVSPFRLKTMMGAMTPFDTTLFLDADMEATSPIGEIWEYSKKGDMWMVRDPAYWPPGITPPLKAPITYYNSGTVLWNSCAITSALFSAWTAEWDNANRNEDQWALARAQASTLVIPQELPSRFNSGKGKKGVVFWHHMGSGDGFKERFR